MFERKLGTKKSKIGNLCEHKEGGCLSIIRQGLARGNWGWGRKLWRQKKGRGGRGGARGRGRGDVGGDRHGEREEKGAATGSGNG